HASCWRTSRASSRRGSSLTFGNAHFLEESMCDSHRRRRMYAQKEIRSSWSRRAPEALACFVRHSVEVRRMISGVLTSGDAADRSHVVNMHPRFAGAATSCCMRSRFVVGVGAVDHPAHVGT